MAPTRLCYSSLFFLDLATSDTLSFMSADSDLVTKCSKTVLRWLASLCSQQEHHSDFYDFGHCSVICLYKSTSKGKLLLLPPLLTAGQLGKLKK